MIVLNANIMTHGSLFSGIGGAELAASWMGWNNLFHCEIDPFCQRILNYWFPESKSYGDITKTDFRQWRGKIDVLTGGFPCQPFSLAGKRQGTTDNRYLWPEMLRAIREIQPAWVVGENVGGIVSMVQPGTEIEMGCEASLFEEDYYTEEEQTYVIETICEDFEDEGYSVQPILIPACAVGAPHRRNRVWFVAHRNSDRRRVWKNEQEFVEKRKGKTNNSISSQNGIITNTNGNGRLLPRESFGTKEKKCIISQQSERRFSTERTNGLFGFQQSIAYPNRNRFFGCDGKDEKQSSKRWVYVLDDAQQVGFERGKYTKNDWSNFPTQSPVCDRNDGLSHRLVDISFPKWRNEAIKAMGNAWVPQVAYEIFKIIDTLNS
jgi:DNA (cytosine-5)-methyltransferase 1